MVRFGRSPHSSMQHLNGNLLCAIDVETTGFDPQKNDVIQLCVLPLDAEIRPLKSVMPFFVEMIPKRPQNVDREASKVHRLNMAEIMSRGIDPWKAVDLFDEWFQNLGLPINKKITPLAHNWPFDREFVKEWIGGPISFEGYFHHLYRDSMAASIFMNDRADFRGARYPYPKNSLSYLGTIFGVENQKAHDALQDCITTAEIYRRLILDLDPV